MREWNPAVAGSVSVVRNVLFTLRMLRIPESAAKQKRIKKSKLWQAVVMSWHRVRNTSGMETHCAIDLQFGFLVKHRLQSRVREAWNRRAAGNDACWRLGKGKWWIVIAA